MLAVGSGSVFTSAAFSDNVNPSSDMRVVVEDAANLLVEPGASFRGGSATGSYDSSLDPANGKFAGDSNNNFFGSSPPGQGTSDALGSSIDVDDLPVAFVSDATNGNLSIQVAVQLGETATFKDLLQVTNNGTGDVDIGIKFSTFGVDTTSTNLGGNGDFPDQGGNVQIENAVGAYTFSAPGISTGSDQISTDANNFSGLSDPTVDSQQIPSPALTVSGGGTTEQINLDVDMTSSATAGPGDFPTQVNGAADPANPGSGAFNEKEDTVQLVQEITIGTGAGSETL
jgi:hypothetical protein